LLCDAGACTLPDTCQVGSCVAGPPRNCDDLTVCTADACDGLIGCTNTPINCDDGDACTIDLCDPVQACRHIVDTQDTDGDGRPNSCDVCPLDAQDDADGDGKCGDVDNCPLVANASQLNVNGGAAGNLCDSATIWIDAASPCTGSGCGSAAAPYRSIQAAVAGTTGTKAFVVRPGIYAENVVLGSRRIDLESQAGSAITTIQGGGVTAAISLDAGGSTRSIYGFTITNTGAGPAISATGKVNIWNNVITGAFSPQDGGGIRILSSTGDVHGNQITGNSSSGSGGGIYVESATTKFYDNVIQNNRARTGGGIYLKSSASTVEDSTIENNVATRDGAGLAVDGSAAQIRRNQISGNNANVAALGRGGAIYATNSAPLIQENRIEGNGAYSGGGVYFLNATANLQRNRIDSNSAFGGGGAGIAVSSLSALAVGSVVADNFVSGNASSGVGGGFWCDGSAASVEVVNNTFVGNAGTSGGGVYLGACTGSVSNNIVGSSAAGQGVFCGASAVFTFTGNNIWGNVGGNWGGACAPTATDFSLTSLFAAPVCGGVDFHLAPNSPDREAGSNGAPSQTATDIDLGQRVVDGDLDGMAVIDVGADEWSCEDRDGDGFSACTAPADCDDTNAAVHPNAAEVCDGLDNNCNCQVDEGVSVDADGDGYTTCGGDCDDANAATNPGAAEICNGFDENCNGAVDEGFTDRCVSGAQADFELGDAFGPAGSTAGLSGTLSITASGTEVAGLSVDIQFPSSILTATPTCTVNPAIGPLTSVGKQLSQNLVSPGTLRVLIIGPVNATPIPAGDVFSCQLPIAATAPAGSYGLVVSADGSSPTGVDIPMNGRSGSLTVPISGGTTASGLIGDCNGDGSVRVSEVQTVVNIFTGAQPASACPAADANGDNQVGIVELQNTINNHLGL
jgi:hypothetical protein